VCKKSATYFEKCLKFLVKQVFFTIRVDCKVSVVGSAFIENKMLSNIFEITVPNSLRAFTFPVLNRLNSALQLVRL